MIRFRLGLVVNPLAGLGGSVGLKGSDGVAEEALALGAEPKAALRMMQALEVIRDYSDDIEVITASGIMGEDAAKTLGFTTRVVYQTPDKTQALDTQAVVRALLDEPLDLLLLPVAMARPAMFTPYLNKPLSTTNSLCSACLLG